MQTEETIWARHGSVLELKSVMLRDFGITGGEIRLKIDRPQEGHPDYLVIDGTEDEYFGSDDEKFEDDGPAL